MLGADERAHLGGFVRGVSDLDAPRGVDQRVQEAVVHRPLDEDPRARTAVLASVVEDRVGRRRGRLLEIGVLEDDVRRLAAELERDALDGLRGALHDEPSDLGRAGEADLRHVRVLDQALPDHRALADEHADHALRDPRLEHELGEPERRERGQLGGLQHYRIAARKRRAELPARDVEREVPGHDQADDPERLAEGHRLATGCRNRLPVVLVHGARIEMEHLRDHADLGPRSRDRLADVARLDRCELLGVLLDEGCDSAQQPGSVGRRDGAPGGVSFLRARDCFVGLLDPCLLELGDRLLGRRVEDCERHLPVRPRLWRIRQIP